MKTGENMQIIGSTELVEIAGIKDIPAKIDTGADSSAISASQIDMKKDGTLVFALFDPKSSLYTGELIDTKDYTVSYVKSSIGKKQVRYRVKLAIEISKKHLLAVFTLADRSRSTFPVLIGRNVLENNFVVDVSKSEFNRKKLKGAGPLNRALREDPYNFHREYIEKGEK